MRSSKIVGMAMVASPDNEYLQLPRLPLQKLHGQRTAQKIRLPPQIQRRWRSDALARLPVVLKGSDHLYLLQKQ